MAKRHERTFARRQAVQLLYQMEILDVSPARLFSDEAHFVDQAQPPAYTVSLLEGTVREIDWIDDMLIEYSENWALDRMPAVDRAILRLACYEMAFVDEVPVSVAINEAVELAKDFGGQDDSPRFVNGVLGRIAKHLEEQAPQAAEAEDAPEQAPDAEDSADGYSSGEEA